MDTGAERAEAAAVWAMRLADGELAPGARRAFDAWIAADPLNSAAFEEVVGAWQTVDRYATSVPIMAMRRAALAHAHRAAPRRRAGLPPAWAGIAACLVAVVAAAVLWLWTRPDSYQTGIGERRVVVLADGSRLSLDGDSVVQVRLTGDRRRLWLTKGRAKFDVAKDALRPFSVTAGDKIVVATGTQFSVERLGGTVRVILYEGHVAVLRDSGAAPAPVEVPVAHAMLPAERVLRPGYELALAPASSLRGDGDGAHLARIDPVGTLGWESGLLVFSDEPLTTAVARVNRYLDHPLQLADDRTGELRISGVFHAGDIRAFADGLRVFDVRTRRSPDGSSLILSR